MSCDQGRRTVLIGGALMAAAMTAREANSMNVDTSVEGFLDALPAKGPHPSLGKEADTFGRLIGTWTGTYEDRNAEGTLEKGSMEVHFTWALDGRAVQDVWISPSREERRAGRPRGKRDTYGSTLRVFDSEIDAWRAVWTNPAKDVRIDLIGRRVGDDIVQTGWYHDAAIKWTFTRITHQSFVWRGFELDADGTTWRMVTEFNLQRSG